MATLNELIYNIKNVMYHGVSNIDDTISDAQIEFWINTERAKILKDEFEANKLLNPLLIQDLGCVPVKCIDRIECCDLGYESEETIYKTDVKIPKPLFVGWTALSNPAMFTYVGLVTHNKPFEFTSEAISNWSIYKRYTHNTPRAFYRNEHIYITNITNPSHLEVINIKGVFEYPTEVKTFNKCSGDPCFTKDSDYPMTPHLIPILNELIIAKYGTLIMQTQNDTLNDKNNKVKIQNG